MFATGRGGGLRDQVPRSPLPTTTLSTQAHPVMVVSLWATWTQVVRPSAGNHLADPHRGGTASAPDDHGLSTTFILDPV